MKLIYRLIMIALNVAVLYFQIGESQNLLHQPESVIYDQSNERYLVSNFETGHIVAIDSEGNQTYFDTTLTRIAGMMTRRDTLFVAANLAPYNGLVAYDLLTDEMLFYLPIASVGLLNDLDYDNRGFIYISDYWDNKLWRVNMSDITCSLFVDPLPAPNGVLCDTLNNRLLVISVSGSTRPILAVDFDDGSVSVVVNTYGYAGDGLARDDQGRIYASEWATNSCHRYDLNFSHPPQTVSSGHDGPADIYINPHSNMLCVPNFYRNTVDFIPLTSSDITEGSLPDKISHSRSYPNPFNAQTTIEYSVTVASDVKVSIYDILGNVVSLLKNDYHEAGVHSVTWKAENFASGVYFYKIESAEFSESKRMMLLK